MSNNREFLMLASDWDRERDSLIGCYVSEKLDGVRCFWDGGITRGKLCNEVPFANTAKDKKPVRASGLWSRYGKPFQAPSWWLDKMPVGVAMDGELYLGRGKFQETVSIVQRDIGDERWKEIKFKAFDLPGLFDVFRDGRINNTNFKKVFDGVIGKMGLGNYEKSKLFDYNVIRLSREFGEFYHHQEALPYSRAAALARIDEMLEDVEGNGGEGLILRWGGLAWEPKRVSRLRKVKSWLDTEGVVVGHEPGKGKYEGMLGSLLVNVGGKIQNVSGFTDAERCKVWEIGTVIRIKYKGLTDDGKLREARYFR